MKKKPNRKKAAKKPEFEYLYRLVEDGGVKRLFPIRGKFETRRANLPTIRSWQELDSLPYPPCTVEQVFVIC